MASVLIADKMSDKAREVFEAQGIQVDYKPGLSQDELMTILPGYDGLAVRSATKVRRQLLEAGSALKVIGRAGIGVDTIDVEAASERGVVVMNTPHGNAITTAEHALAMMVALARQIPQASASTHAGKWEKSKFMGTELYGKTLGVVGAGNIGGLVIERAVALGMRVAAFDPYLSPDRARELGCEKVELAELYRRADIITLHTPLTDKTRHMIDSHAFSQMKDGVRLVNCARGGLVAEDDLKEALDSGKVAGAALDVFETEPPEGSPLLGHERLVCTPHLGASTTEAQEKVAIQVAEQMSAYLSEGAVQHAVNMPSVTAEEAPRLRPYMTLVEQMGSFAGQITETAIDAVDIDFAGDAARLNTRPLVSLALAGLLRPQLDDVNVVSAPVIARQRGIDVSETRRESTRDFHTLVRVTVHTQERTRTLAGTLFGGTRPRIVAIEDVPVEAELTRDMLFLRNLDKPGLIGALGTTLGNNGINIASFHLGRVAEAGHALALVAVDAPIPETVLGQVRALPNVEQARALRF